MFLLLPALGVALAVSVSISRTLAASVATANVDTPTGAGVTLSGTVHSWDERDTATNSAWGTPGVRNVIDRMTLAY